MIERRTIEGREATIAFLTDDFIPTTEDAAALVEIQFDDGEFRFGRRVSKPKASLPWWERERAFNPRHVKTGAEHGGEFATKEGEPGEHGKPKAKKAPAAPPKIGGGEGRPPWVRIRGENVAKEIAQSNIPASHHDGVEINLVESLRVGNTEAYGAYEDAKRTIHMAMGRYGEKGEGRSTILHEMGHHVHLARLTDEAAAEWAALSRDGKSARISQLATMNQSEHFAEAYRDFTRDLAPHSGKPTPSYSRYILQHLEPKAYAFMKRLFRKNTDMLRPPGDYTPLDAVKARAGKPIDYAA